MENDATKNGKELATDAPFSFMDDPIQELMNEGDHDEPGKSGGDAGGGDKDGGEAVSPALQARLDKIQEELEEQKQTAQFLKGQNSILETQLRGGNKEEKPAEKPLLNLPDKAKLQAALSDPDSAVDALTGMFEEFGRNILERVSSVQNEARGEHAKRDQRQAWQNAVAQDRQEAIDEYGEDVLNDKEFIAEADKELEKVIQKRGGRSLADVQPGDFSSVAAKVYNRRMRAGKINVNGNSDNREARRPTLREISREVSSSDRLGGNGGGNRGGGKTNMRDLYSNEREFRIADSARKKMGVSEEAWVRNYQAGQAEDEGYGR